MEWSSFFFARLSLGAPAVLAWQRESGYEASGHTQTLSVYFFPEANRIILDYYRWHSFDLQGRFPRERHGHSAAAFLPPLQQRNTTFTKKKRESTEGKKSKPPLHPATLMLVLFVSISIYAVWNLAGREYSMHWWGEWMYKNLVWTLAKSKLQPFSPSDSHSGWC